MSNARWVVVAALVALSSGVVCAQGERPEGVPEMVIDKERMCPVVEGALLRHRVLSDTASAYERVRRGQLQPDHSLERPLRVGQWATGPGERPCRYHPLRLHLHVEGVTADARAL